MWIELVSGSLKVNNTILFFILAAIVNNKVMLMEPPSIVSVLSMIYYC